MSLHPHPGSCEGDLTWKWGLHRWDQVNHLRMRSSWELAGKAPMERMRDSPATCRILPWVGVPERPLLAPLKGQGSWGSQPVALSGFFHFPSTQVHALLGCEVPRAFQKAQERPTTGQNRLALLTTHRGPKGPSEREKRGRGRGFPPSPEAREGRPAWRVGKAMWAPTTVRGSHLPRPHSQPPAAWVGPASTSTLFWEPRTFHEVCG